METNSLIPLDEALYRLLYHRSYREAFFNENFSSLGLCESDQRHLATIDREQLKKTASRVVTQVLYGADGQSGGIEGIFPRVLRKYRKTFPKDPNSIELIERFLESNYYRDYREHPYAGNGICIEEAFFEFMNTEKPFIDADATNAFLLKDEFLVALMRTLLYNPRASFQVRQADIFRIGEGYYSIQTMWPDMILYAAVKGHFVRGPITPLIAEILRLADGAKIQARTLSVRFNTSIETVQAAFDRLTHLGFLH